MAQITKAVGFVNAGLYDILSDISADLAALRTAVNGHTHTENTAVSYTQNATSGAANAGTAGALKTSVKSE